MGEGRGPARQWTPVATLVISLLVTTVASLLLAQTLNARNAARFDAAAEEAAERIQRRIRTYADMLRGAAGLFAANEGKVTRTEFRAFADRLAVMERYPGIRGIGFSQRVPASAVEEVTRAVREGGAAGFRIWPEHDAPEYFPIVYLEPLDERNLAAAGYDMYSEPVRREAMRRAWLEGEPALSARVVLKQEIEARKQPGFLLYVPVYEGGDIPPTEEERLRRLIGFVYAPFRADDFFTGIFVEDDHPRVALRVWDGADPEDAKLLHDSSARGVAASNPAFTRTTTIDVAGRPWTLRFTSLPLLESAAPKSLVPAIALVGLLVSLVLFTLAHAQARARRQAEQSAIEARESRDQLEAERARLTSLFMAAPAAIALTEGPEHRYVLSNHTNNEWLGHREVLGKPVREALPEAESDGFLSLLDRVYQHGESVHSAEAPLRVKQADGTVREQYIHFVYQPTLDAAGRIGGVAGFAFDVTAQVVARREAEALADALRQSRAQLEAVFQSMHDGVTIFDPSGNLVFFNEAQWRILDFPDADALTRSLPGFRETFELFTAGDELLPFDAWPATRVLRGETVREVEVRGRRIDTGKEWHFSISGAPVTDESGRQILAVVILRDVTARVAAERALKESEAHFRTLADAIPQLAWIAEADGTVRWFNRRWYDFAGMGEGDAPEDWTRLLAEDERDRVIEGYRAAIESGQPWEDTFHLRGKDGALRWHLGRAMPVRGESGRVVRWFGTNTDVEEERRHAAVLGEALEARDVFLSVASHELKTPLTPLALRLSHLKREAKGTNPSHSPRVAELRGLEIAEGQIRKLAALVDGLLDVSRLAGGRLSLVLEESDVARVVRETAQAMSPQAERAGSELRVDAARPAVGNFDRLRLGQVVTNLLSNAIKFGAGRPIHVEVGEVDGVVRLSVRDEGIGIAPEHLERIFGRFERGVSDRHYGGLGLGLYVTRQIVETMGGTIRVESAPGQGATFVVELPKSGPPETDAEQPRPA